MSQMLQSCSGAGGHVTRAYSEDATVTGVQEWTLASLRLTQVQLAATLRSVSAPVLMISAGHQGLFTRVSRLSSMSDNPRTTCTQSPHQTL